MSASVITSLEVLQKPVSELSPWLRLQSVEHPSLVLRPHLPGTVSLDEYDVLVDENHDIRIIEPTCGRLMHMDGPEVQSPNQRTARHVLDAVYRRRELLSLVTREVMGRARSFPRVIERLRMQEIADAIDVHVTTVSRTVDHKLCRVSGEIVPLRSVFR